MNREAAIQRQVARYISHADGIAGLKSRDCGREDHGDHVICADDVADASGDLRGRKAASVAVKRNTLPIELEGIDALRLAAIQNDHQIDPRVIVAPLVDVNNRAVEFSASVQNIARRDWIPGRGADALERSFRQETADTRKHEAGARRDQEAGEGGSKRAARKQSSRDQRRADRDLDPFSTSIRARLIRRRTTAAAIVHA